MLATYQQAGLKKLSDYELGRQLEAVGILMGAYRPDDLSEGYNHLRDIRDFLATEQIRRGRDNEARLTGEIPHPLARHLKSMSKRDLHTLRINVQNCAKLLPVGMSDVADRAAAAITREIAERRDRAPKMSLGEWELVSAKFGRSPRLFDAIDNFFEDNDGV